MGEDVGALGSVMGVTRGLLERFGPERIIDTPISETGFVGAAIGAAMTGMRPIVEIMFVDFTGVCFDQFLNNMAKIHYESGGNVRVPLVVTTAIGAGYSDAAQQSQSLYSLFAHIPGLKIVVPSTPYDAKGLMISAIRDDNPVIFFFHKAIMGLEWMYPFPEAMGHVPEKDYEIPLGKADIKRSGTDLTIATVSLMVYHALEAADRLAKQGIEAEVLDLRTLVPLDREALGKSIRKTKRLLVVDEDYKSFGMSGELIATAVEEATEFMVAPPRRLATPDVSIPFSPVLEEYILPNRESIYKAAYALVKG
jgi:pyruvate dehydrogenase E1 component beta subunit